MLTGVSAFLGDQLSPGSIWVSSSVTQDQVWEQREARRLLSQAAPGFPCPEGFGQVLLRRRGVSSVLTGLSALLGGSLSLSGIWVWSTVAQDQLWAQTPVLRNIAFSVFFFILIKYFHK